MHAMEDLRDMLCEELEKLTQSRELSAGSLDAVDKLTHSIKSIDTIMAMEGGGYSQTGYNGNSYARRRGRSNGRSYGRMSRNYSGDANETIEKIEAMLGELRENE